MLKNYLKISLRNLKRYTANSFISVTGLAVGMMSCMFLILYIDDELGYDRFHEKTDRVFRVVTDVVNDNGAADHSAYSFTALGPAVVNHLPNVEAATRIGVSWSSSFVRVGEKHFNEERILVADSSFFDLFTYRFIEGTPQTALNRPNTVVLTQSTAERYFGEENPIGRTINRENNLNF